MNEYFRKKEGLKTKKLLDRSLLVTSTIEKGEDLDETRNTPEFQKIIEKLEHK